MGGLGPAQRGGRLSLDDLGGEKERMPVLVLDEAARRDESLLVLPLRAANRTLGALVITADRGIFGATTKRVLGILANQAAALLARIQLTEKIREKAMRDPLHGAPQSARLCRRSVAGARS